MRALVTLALLLGFVSGCACQSEPGAASQQDAPSPEEISMDHVKIEAMARVVLPEGAQDVQTHVAQGGQDEAIWLRMTLPSDQVQGFLASAGYKEEDLSARRRKLRASSGSWLPWWDPESLDPFLSGAYERREGKPSDYASHVIVGQGPGERQTLYLFVTQL